MVTGLALAAHNGVTVSSLGVPGYGRTLLAKLIAGPTAPAGRS